MHPFVKDRADFDRLGARTIEMLAEYLRALPAQPVDRVVPEDVRRRLMSLPLPEQGLAPDEMLEFLRREILPWPIAIGHRRSYGWVNSPPAPISILADAVATTMNSGLDGYDHSALFLMSSVGRWIMELVGFPTEGSLCLLLTGGSAATLNALTAARHRAAERAGWNLRAEGLQGGRPRSSLYASAESHSSIQKCVEQLGIGTDNLRADSGRRRLPHAARTPCARAIERDLRAGPPAVRDRRLRRRDEHGRDRPAGRDRRRRGASSTSGCTSTARSAPGRRSIPPMRTGSGALRARTRSRSIRTSGRRCRSTAARC